MIVLFCTRGCFITFVFSLQIKYDLTRIFKLRIALNFYTSADSSFLTFLCHAPLFVRYIVPPFLVLTKAFHFKLFAKLNKTVLNSLIQNLFGSTSKPYLPMTKKKTTLPAFLRDGETKNKRKSEHCIHLHLENFNASIGLETCS